MGLNKRVFFVKKELGKRDKVTHFLRPSQGIRRKSNPLEDVLYQSFKY
jgi:hypothetical protein